MDDNFVVLVPENKNNELINNIEMQDSKTESNSTKVSSDIDNNQVNKDKTELGNEANGSDEMIIDSVATS